MIKLDRDYSSAGIISAGSGLYIMDEILKKFVLLVPTSDMPAESAPETIENPLLTVSVNGQVEGKQTMEQKEYTMNWTRDNMRRLDKYTGKTVQLLERDGMQFTGRKFNGTISYGKDSQSDNSIMNGKIWVTVTEDLGYVDDIRDIIAPTAIVTSPLSDVTIVATGSTSMAVESSEDATVTATSEAESIATVKVESGVLTVTGVKAGNTIIAVTATATGEGTSTRTFLVTVA